MMEKNNKPKKKKFVMEIPNESLLNDLYSNEEGIRFFPSIDILDDARLEIVKERTAGLINLLGVAGNPKRVSEYIAKELTEKNYSEKTVFDEKFDLNESNYFFRDPWIKSGMIIVKEGRLPITEGFNLILAHIDTPCLRVKPLPLKVEDENPYSFLGVRLSAMPHGGILNYQWMGQQVKIVGDRFIKNKRFPVEFYGIVADSSAHINVKEFQNVEEAFSSEKSLEIIIGDMDPIETLQSLGFKSFDDFSNSELYAIPINSPLLMGGKHGRLLVGYGHDDLSCVYPAKSAIIDANNPKLTSIIWLSDKEESGESPPTGAEGPFMERVVDYLIEKQERKLNKSFSLREKNLIYLKSSALLGDVDIAPSGYDSEDMDSRNAPKIGLGVFISSGQGQVSDSRFVYDLRALAKKGVSKRDNLFHQVCGNFYSQDMHDLWCYDAPNSFFKKIGRWAWAGVPCASAHSHNEIVCSGDEYWAYRFYKRFFESDLGLKNPKL
jgi:aspartyl aminopeptidase